MLVLASKSPRREKLLKDAGLEFITCPSQIEEIIDDRLSPNEVVIELAKQKARDVSLKYPNDLVIGADTIVVCQDEILGKPTDENDAYRMLKMLSNQKHSVFTGVYLIQNGIEKGFNSETCVWMKNLSDLEIWNYIKTKEPMDKAGAYAIQDGGKHLVLRYEGDFFTIVGLPLKALLEAIKTFQSNNEGC